MAVTIYDVAKKAGVSHGTVSRYLNGYSLRENNRTRVEQAIQELNFQENIIAKGLKGNRSMAIAVLTPRYTAVFVMLITTIIEKIVARENYGLVMCNFEDDDEQLRQKLLFLQRRAIDGVIIFPEDKGAAGLRILHEYLNLHIPVVLINEPIPGFETDLILVDNAVASFRAVEQLILGNHKDIAIINGSQESYLCQQRLKGYYEAMQAYNLKVEEEWVKWGNFHSVGGYTATKELCASPHPPSAIFVVSYYMTMGAVMALHELRLRIPDDISIFGFDHFEPADAIQPALTVVEHPVEKIGEQAAHLLLRRIRGDYSDFPQTITLNTTMLIRGSTRNL